jgi:Holliday junction resolvase
VEIGEGDLRFIFNHGMTASKYDDWSFYKNQLLKRFNPIGGVKAVDIIAIDHQIVWLIEIKDYRIECKTNAADLANVVALKIRDTLSGLVAAKNNATGDEQWVAQQALSKHRIRVVLHLEQPLKHSRLRPIVINPADIKQKLKQRLKCIDAHPLVVSKDALHNDIPWSVR